jgi:hypothetical protein
MLHARRPSFALYSITLRVAVALLCSNAHRSEIAQMLIPVNTEEGKAKIEEMKKKKGCLYRTLSVDASHLHAEHLAYSVHRLSMFSCSPGVKHQGTEEKNHKKTIRGKLQNKKQEQEGSRKEQGTEVVGTPYPVIGHRTQYLIEHAVHIGSGSGITRLWRKFPFETQKHTGIGRKSGGIGKSSR